MLISITGKLGSGKSTICNILKERYGFEIFSTGTINREYARSLGITTLELNKRLNEDPSLDHEIDGTVTRLSIERKDDNLIFDSRMAWHFVPSSFSVFIKVSTVIAAERIMKAGRSEETYKTMDEAVENINARHKSETLRYKTLYGVDLDNYDNYDLVVDTDGKTPEQIVEIICDAFDNWLKK